jgi:internalin A
MRTAVSAAAVAVAIAAAACRNPKPVAPTPAPTPTVVEPAPPARAADDPYPWPFAMRVYTWTPDGIAQVGELPWQPPPEGLATPWFIEPTRGLDAAAFAQIVVQVRDQHIPGLSLRGQRVAAWMDQLRDLADLTALVLDDTDVDGAALAKTDLALQRLYVSRTAIDDAGLAAALAKSPLLQVLSAEETSLTDAATPAIAALAELRALDLGGTGLTDAGGAQLAALTKLEIADLGRTRVGAKTVAALVTLPLAELFLDGTIVGKQVKTLAPLAATLQRLDVSSLVDYRPVDADLAWLPQAAALAELGISGSKVTDKLALPVVALPNLVRLRIAGTGVTAKTIEQIAARADTAQAADWEELDLAHTPVDNALGARILSAPKLRFLRLDECPIDDGALAGATPGLGLGELYLARTGVTDAGLAILDQLPHLSGLGLAQTRVSDATVARIAKLVDLRVLVLDDIVAQGDAFLALAALTKLETLTLEGTTAGGFATEKIDGLVQLRVLHLARTSFGDAGVAAMRKLPLLTELTIGDTDVTPATLDLSPWPRLVTLSLVGLEVDDAALAPLASHAPLRELDLTATKVTDPGALLALPRLRTLGLVQTKLSKAGKASVKALEKRGVEVVR